MTQNVVNWFEIYVADMARAKKFYETVLAIKLEEMEAPGIEMWAFPWVDNAAGAPGALAKMEDVAPGPGGVMIYFNCSDCAIEESRVAANGGEVLRSKFSIGQWGWISIIKDSEGNVIGLHSCK